MIDTNSHFRNNILTIKFLDSLINGKLKNIYVFSENCVKFSVTVPYFVIMPYLLSRLHNDSDFQ